MVIFDFVRCLFHDCFIGDRCRTTTAEPVTVAGWFCCCCSEFIVENEVCDWTVGSFRLLFITKSDDGGAGGGISNNDDFECWILFDLLFFVFIFSWDSLDISPRKATLLTSDESDNSSCWTDEDGMGGFRIAGIVVGGGKWERDEVNEELITGLFSTRLCTDRFVDGDFVIVSLFIRCCSVP